MLMMSEKEVYSTSPKIRVKEFLDQMIIIKNELLAIKNEKGNFKKEIMLENKRKKLRKKMDEYLKQWVYIDFLAIQCSESLWSRIMTETDLFMRRRFCRKINNLGEPQIAKVLNISKSSAHDLLHKTVASAELKMSLLAILLNTPRLSIIDIDPSESKDSFETYIEYYGGAAKRVTIDELNGELTSVSSISGYIIDNQTHFFDYEDKLVFGRLIKTYPGLELIEFHLKYEPLLHEEKVKELIKIFPNAKCMLSTFTPLRPNRRCLWIIQNSHSHHEKELKKFMTEIKQREKTVFYYKEEK
jgi:hypothetical protein